jgi:hypothetical protein
LNIGQRMVKKHRIPQPQPSPAKAGSGNGSSRGKLTEKRPNRNLDGCAESAGFLSLNPLPIGANANRASLLTPWDLFDESDAKRALEFDNEACQSAGALMPYRSRSELR